MARFLASRAACRVHQPGAYRLKERNRERIYFLHSWPERLCAEEQARRDDRALGVRDVAYGALLGLIRDRF